MLDRATNEFPDIRLRNLQALAEPGGIVLSAAAHDTVRKTIDTRFSPLGPQRLKNIEAPMVAFAAARHGGTRSPRMPAGDPGDQASIVVLPFANASADPEQDYLCDGIVEDITLALAHVPRLFVVAHNSAFT
jgi:adenylate cyclase